MVSPRRSSAPTRADRPWFGGDNGSGVAYAGGVWDFETPGSNGVPGLPLLRPDREPSHLFGRVTALDFLNGGDPCIPMILGTPGMIWCGGSPGRGRASEASSPGDGIPKPDVPAGVLADVRATTTRPHRRSILPSATSIIPSLATTTAYVYISATTPQRGHR